MFRNSLRMKEPPLPSEKRGAAKAIADQMIAKHLSGRRVFRDFALRVVALSPDSFSTELGNGVDSFACLIENAYYNHPSMRLQSKSNIRSDLYAAGTSGRKRKGVDLKESYGCTNWQQSNLPRGETKESQEEKRKILKTEFSKLSQNANKVGNLMKATYVTQRFEINKKPTKPLCELREEWPYLFLTPFYDNHFYKLTSTSYKTFHSNLTKKVGPLYKFLCDTKQGKFSKNWQQKIKEAKESEENEQCVTLAAVFMLCEYFGENKDVMFKEVEEDADFSTFKTDLPSPCVVYAGCNPFLRNRMAITVDREPLLYPTSIIAALKMLFMSYYVFNICYPTEVQATMEYIQRILFEIDPGRGSRAKKSYRWCINPKVTSLCERMKESREGDMQ
ncbi:uncharacterized protein [Apostichopus japonicus]|uniref:uncharacterized protein n=1 Tax=Stichopus japonicus TaxID=307972 RepID=UPI003AB1DE4B